MATVINGGSSSKVAAKISTHKGKVRDAGKVTGRGRNGPKPLKIAADGRSRVVRQIQLPANAIVDQFDLRLTARRADLVKAQGVADLRSADDATSPALVVDFGVLRTINQVLLPEQFSIQKLIPWLGTKFDTEIVLSGALPALVERGKGASAYNLKLYPIPETRTERLRIELASTDASKESVLESLIETLELSLPELPANLSLRINGGAPVWEHSGVVQLATSSELDENGWTEDGERLVSIADALDAFGGDATSSERVDLTLEMTSSVPGVLKIDVVTESMRLLHRLDFDGRDELNLVYDSEGEQQVLLSAPDGASPDISGVLLTLKGEFPPQRVLPPLGPPSNNLSELLLGSGRAACVRLDGVEGLTELTAVRFPLENKSSSAEARVILWNDQDGVPVEALSDEVSEPVNWSSDTEQWITFDFTKPVPFDPATPLWAALIISRGEVIWKMAAANSDGNNPIRLGAPEGPWRVLPAMFGTGTVLGPVAGRVHIAGLPEAGGPLAPLLISLEGGPEDQAVTPTDDGLQIQLDITPTTNTTGEIADKKANTLVDAGRTLSIISLSAGSVRLSEVDVITGVV